MPEQAVNLLSLRDTLAEALTHSIQSDPDSVETATLRLIQCAIGDRDALAREQGECQGCPDKHVYDLLQVMAEQRRQSANQYDESGRIEEAERERAELAIIESYLPRKLDADELKNAVSEVIVSLEAQKLKDLGRCMKALKERFPGRVETGSAKSELRSALQNVDAVSRSDM